MIPSVRVLPFRPTPGPAPPHHPGIRPQALKGTAMQTGTINGRLFRLLFVCTAHFSAMLGCSSCSANDLGISQQGLVQPGTVGSAGERGAASNQGLWFLLLLFILASD